MNTNNSAARNEFESIAANYISDLIERIDKSWRADFERFVETGEAEEGFLRYLDENSIAQNTVEEAFNRQVKKFEGLAAELKAQSITPDTAHVAPVGTSSTVSARVAAFIDGVLRASPVRRRLVVERGAADIAASISPGERSALKQVVDSLDRNLEQAVSKVGVQ